MQKSLEEYLYLSQKALAQTLEWVESGNCYVMTASLSIEGVVTDGLQIIGKAKKCYQNRDVSVMLAYKPERQRPRLLGRIDWRPFHNHNNKEQGPAHLQNFLQEGSHYHTFDLNWLPQETRMREGNLTLAEPLAPDPPEFKELVARIEDSFRIEGLSSEFTAPPWDIDLFGNG